MRTRAPRAAVAAGMGLAVFAAGIPAVSAAPASANTPVRQASPRCDPADVAKVVTKKRYRKTNEKDVLYNRTRDTITRRVHFEKSTTTKYSVSGGVEASFNAGRCSGPRATSTTSTAIAKPRRSAITR